MHHNYHILDNQAIEMDTSEEIKEILDQLGLNYNTGTMSVVKALIKARGITTLEDLEGLTELNLVQGDITSHEAKSVLSAIQSYITENKQLHVAPVASHSPALSPVISPALSPASSPPLGPVPSQNVPDLIDGICTYNNKLIDDNQLVACPMCTFMNKVNDNVCGACDSQLNH